MSSPCIEINGHKIGDGCPAYIIAEMSGNHGHDYDKAARIIEAAKKAGADAVKIQTYTPDTITIDSNAEYFRINEGTIWDGRNLYQLYAEAYTPWEWQPKLKKVADDLGIDLFSSPFDHSAVDFLEEMNVPAYKIASFELVDLPLIEKVASLKKPMIVSTGMATLGEIEEAVQTIKKAGNTEFALLKCTSAYPALPGEINLRTIEHLSRTFCVPTGLSDHTLGSAVAVAAVALGASIIEKHFTISRNDPGPDSSFSMEPQEFEQLVNEVRTVEQALGNVYYGVSAKEAGSRIFRRSLFVVQNVKAGQEFTAENVRSIRPGMGLHTRNLDMVLGCRATEDIARGTPLSWDLVGRKAKS